MESASTSKMNRPAKREAFTNIPQRQHRRITSRSSEVPSDAEQGPVPKPSAPNPRKRSTKPAHLARTLDKENTPSPPRGASASAYATPVRARTLVGHLLEREDVHAQGPPSPASSSELSPVAQDMMSNLRTQRMRARQVERRKGMWVRE
ncbi:hypothetical protein FKP32DRAFT_1570015 [Trametes sanguinea]|nr:hypothetical protein FKP32DRAFT_1570015 [Trametes sanguinea]